jgi:FkbM family methyltransferase
MNKIQEVFDKKRLTEKWESFQEISNIFRKVISKEIKVSYSQCGEDLIIKVIFDDLRIKNPSYLDIGAYDPEYISNTALFYRNGSRGINVEPDLHNFQKFLLKRRRDINLNIGVSDVKGNMNFYTMSTPTLSTFSQIEVDNYVEQGFSVKSVDKIQVDTVSNIIAKYWENCFPDFLSLDVEGLDEIVLRSINYEKSSPIVICVETITFSENGTGIKKTSIINFLESKGYMVFADTYINTIFVKRNRWVRA